MGSSTKVSSNFLRDFIDIVDFVTSIWFRFIDCGREFENRQLGIPKIAGGKDVRRQLTVSKSSMLKSGIPKIISLQSQINQLNQGTNFEVLVLIFYSFTLI